MAQVKMIHPSAELLCKDTGLVDIRVTSPSERGARSGVSEDAVPAPYQALQQQEMDCRVKHGNDGGVGS